jgi:uncharacterized membrane protein YkoI
MRAVTTLIIVAAAAAAAAGVVHAADEARPARAKESSRVLRVFEVLTARLVAPEKAIAAAVAARPGAAVEIELGTLRKDEKTLLVWEIAVVDGAKLHDVVVNAEDGAVVSESEDDDAAEAKKYAALLATPGLSLAEIVLKARAAIGGTAGAAIVHVELDDEDGKAVFEVGAVAKGARSQVGLNRADGQVVPDDDEDGDDEDGDDEEDEDEDEGD